MPIELKNALAEWKKAKPLMLTKTGVSEALRLLPTTAPASADAIEKSRQSLEKVKKVIDVAVENKHIKAEKKAHTCLVEIQTAIKTELAKLHTAAEAAKTAAATKAAEAKAAEVKAAAAKTAAQEYANASKDLKQWLGRMAALLNEWDASTPGQPRVAAPLARFTVIHQEISNRLLHLVVPADHPHASDISTNRRAISAMIGDLKGGFGMDVKDGYEGGDSTAATTERRLKVLKVMQTLTNLL